ncbi:MAG: hypothetical protein EZS28_018432 [Streblomastix strix]|uniref:Tyr recombinase domain-containing protein n=1 Tax=Streblomastix strix TaxID=222440 RepID=A0A5J4VUG1_9EUKA|nr:MAG: hypothetical protein EZS28_018432 [Streblomastix strix]
MQADQLNILTDNQEAVMNIQRKAAASILTQTIRKILEDAQKMGIVVNANHIKGIDNKKAYALRGLELAGDYEIRIKYLNIVLQQQDLKLEADMIATKYNKKCLKYYAPTSDEEAAGEDCSQIVNSQELHSDCNCDGLGKLMVVQSVKRSCYADNNIRQFGASVQGRKINEEKKNEVAPRKGPRSCDKNWIGDIIFKELALAKHLTIREQQQLIEEMSPNLQRLRRAAPASLDTYLAQKKIKSKQTLKSDVALNVRRAHNGLQQSKKTVEEMIAIRRGVCSIFSLLTGIKYFTRSPLLSSLMKPLVGKKVKKSRNSKAWDINQLFNYERMKYNDQIQLNVMQHAIVLLVAYSKMRVKFLTSYELWYYKRNIVVSEQGVRDQLRARIRQAGIEKSYWYNIIRHLVITELRKAKLSVEQVNQLTDHAPGSVIIEQYYNKPEHPLGIEDIIGQSVPAALSDQTLPL